MRSPFPLKQCFSVLETLVIIGHEQVFPLPHALLPETKIVLGEEGGKFSVQIRNMQRVQGSLASIFSFYESQ